MDPLQEQLLETWRTNQRINLFLIDRIGAEGMRCTLSKRGGRTVGRQFAHLHNQRVYHLEGRARDLATDLVKLPASEQPSKTALKRSLRASAKQVEIYFRESMAASGTKGKYRPLKKGVVATLGYFIAHESHHRGSILLTLKECGHKLDQKTQSTIWNWDKM